MNTEELEDVLSSAPLIMVRTYIGTLEVKMLTNKQFNQINADYELEYIGTKLELDFDVHKLCNYGGKSETYIAVGAIAD